ncbi:MAG: FAD-linked oxidase C-terminal domain-containing protein, partial [bacterium]
RQAAAAATEIAAGTTAPAAVEVMDRATLAAVARFGLGDGKAASGGEGLSGGGQRGPVGGGWWAGAGGLLLVEVDGTRAVCEAEAARIREAVGKGGRVLAERQARYPEAEGLWQIRRAALGALAAASPTVMIENFSTGPDKVEDLLGRVEAAARRHEVEIAAFGHAAEGVMHVALATDGRDPEEAARAREAWTRLESACDPLGARISGRGGTGLIGMPPVRARLAGASLEIVRRVKDAFDPDGMINPGKLTAGGPSAW